jgi:hypothetical protein
MTIHSRHIGLAGIAISELSRNILVTTCEQADLSNPFTVATLSLIIFTAIDYFKGWSQKKT